jgi:hypothetical protein
LAKAQVVGGDPQRFCVGACALAAIDVDVLAVDHRPNVVGD